MYKKYDIIMPIAMADLDVALKNIPYMVSNLPKSNKIVIISNIAAKKILDENFAGGGIR